MHCLISEDTNKYGLRILYRDWGNCNLISDVWISPHHKASEPIRGWDRMTEMAQFLLQHGNTKLTINKEMRICSKAALGPVSISDKTSCRKISWSLEAAKLVFIIVWSLWNLTGTSAALLPMCLSNFKAMRKLKLSISRLRDFTRSNDKTSYRILKRGPGCCPFFSLGQMAWLFFRVLGNTQKHHDVRETLVTSYMNLFTKYPLFIE